MTALVDYVFSTGGVVLALFGGAAWLWSRPGSRMARLFLVAAAVFYTLASTLGVTSAAGRVLALGFRPFQISDVPSGATAVVVLGSGGFTARDWSGNRFAVPDPSAATRVLEALRVFKLIEPEWIICSGGRLDAAGPNEPTGRTNGNTLLQLGVPESRLVVDITPRTTAEEAAAVTSRLRSLGISHAVLVTSGTHMRRARGAFRAQGFEVVPAVARSSNVDLSRRYWWMPSGVGLDEGATVAHEVLGLAYYRARGWYK